MSFWDRIPRVYSGFSSVQVVGGATVGLPSPGALGQTLITWLSITFDDDAAGDGDIIIRSHEEPTRRITFGVVSGSGSGRGPVHPIFATFDPPVRIALASDTDYIEVVNTSGPHAWVNAGGFFFPDGFDIPAN